MTILQRVRLRIPDTDEAPDAQLQNYIDTITARLCLRLGAEALPLVFETICADAVVKMWRRTYYEGISSEGSASITTSFVEDILAEYEREIQDYRSAHADDEDSTQTRTVRFI